MGGSLTESELGIIHLSKIHSKINYFVETGTYKADTTLLAAKFFGHVYTTEIHQGLHAEAVERANQLGVTNVTFMHGDSIQLLREIVPKVLSGAVFFLDAHISGSDSGWNGTHRVPILEELDVILSHRVGPSVFIIDDVRLWKSSVWDWAHITTDKIIKIFMRNKHHVITHYEKDDRYYVYTG